VFELSPLVEGPSRDIPAKAVACSTVAMTILKAMYVTAEQETHDGGLQK
jgi:hypothetical protein